MKSPSQDNTSRSLTIRSDSLYSGEFTVSEDTGFRSGRLLSGTRLKAIAVPFLYKLIQHTPIFVAALPMRLLLLLVRIAYIWPGNPFRLACENISTLAANSGYHYTPKQVYRQLINNADGMMDNYFRLYKFGVDSVIDRVHIAENDVHRMNHLAEKHGGVVLAVPHNYASLFSALKMSREFPLICVTRNPSTIERTKIGVEFFERMKVRILMVRGGNPIELSRALFSILKSGNVIAATVDSMDHSEAAAEAKIFGQQVGFPTWAAKIAAKKRIPVVPSYFRSNGKQISAVFGDELITNETEAIVEHYVQFFEKNILEDPASWAYLCDKRWGKILKKVTD
jgi:lauroyl/myristoyl acyltransferase